MNQKPVSHQDEATPSKEQPGCIWGLELTDCPARRAGCQDNLSVLNYMMPPLTVLTHCREHFSSDPTVAKWLDHIDRVLPGRPTFGPRRGW